MTGWGKQVSGKLWLFIMLGAVLFCPQSHLLAQEKLVLMGQEVTPMDTDYLVKKDVNIREKPQTNSKKLGKIKEGERLKGVGRVNQEWIAAEFNGLQGFVYAPVLAPFINGALEKPIRGKTVGPNGEACEYIINFEGETGDETGNIMAADYEVGWRCIIDGKPQEILGFMFMTETPYDLSNRPVFQISVDMIGITEEPDAVLSTVFLYNSEKQTMTFDTVTMPRYSQEPKIKKHRAKTVEQALAVAVETAPATWQPKTWRILIKRDY